MGTHCIHPVLLERQVRVLVVGSSWSRPASTSTNRRKADGTGGRFLNPCPRRASARRRNQRVTAFKAARLIKPLAFRGGGI